MSPTDANSAAKFVHVAYARARYRKCRKVLFSEGNFPSRSLLPSVIARDVAHITIRVHRSHLHKSETFATFVAIPEGFGVSPSPTSFIIHPSTFKDF